MIAMRFLDVIKDEYARDEIKNVIDQIKAWAMAEHDEEGRHIVGDRDLAFVSVGSTVGWHTDTPPDGWVFLHGQSLNRVTYKTLFELWGTRYGAGDGTTTFNVFDARGRFMLNKAASGTGDTLGETGGELDHDHAAGTLAGPSHTHGAGSYVTPSHDHGGNTGVGSDETEICSNCGPGSVLHDTQVYDHTHTIPSQGAMSISGTSGSGGTGAVTGSTATANPAYFVEHRIVFTGVMET